MSEIAVEPTLGRGPLCALVAANAISLTGSVAWGKPFTPGERNNPKKLHADD